MTGPKSFLRNSAPLMPVVFMLLTGCMGQPERVMTISSPPQAGPNRIALDGLIARIGDQVRRCYRAPTRQRAARQIVTVMQVRYGPDGMVLGLPLVAEQSGIAPEGIPYAAAMADAARTAIIRCSPIAAPPELHQNGWDELYLTFSPKGSA